MTYGEGKEKVEWEKLENPDKMKYKIHDVVKAILSCCTSPNDLQSLLEQSGIETIFKLKRTTNEIEGISFSYNNVAFKGSQIDRKFSSGNLKKIFKKNIKIQQEQAEKEQEKQLPKVPQKTEDKPKLPTIGGIELTSEQWKILKEGGHSYLESMKKKDGSGSFSLYVFLNDERNKALFKQ